MYSTYISMKIQSEIDLSKLNCKMDEAISMHVLVHLDWMTNDGLISVNLFALTPRTSRISNWMNLATSLLLINLMPAVQNVEPISSCLIGFLAWKLNLGRCFVRAGYDIANFFFYFNSSIKLFIRLQKHLFNDWVSYSMLMLRYIYVMCVKSVVHILHGWSMMNCLNVVSLQFNINNIEFIKVYKLYRMKLVGALMILQFQSSFLLSDDSDMLISTNGIGFPLSQAQN